MKSTSYIKCKLGVLWFIISFMGFFLREPWDAFSEITFWAMAKIAPHVLFLCFSSLVSSTPQSTLPSATSWVIVSCPCFVNLSIAATTAEERSHSTAVHGLAVELLPLECHSPGQPRPGRGGGAWEIDDGHWGKFWFWQNFFEYKSANLCGDKNDDTCASIFHAQLQVFPWGGLI